MLYFYIFISLFIAWIWVDYFRLIDIYEKEKLVYIVLTFFLGAASVLLVFVAHRYLFQEHYLSLNGNVLNDFLYATFQVGMLEEICKTIPFLLALLFFGKEINEPVDYLAFICFSALGFSACENVFYFMEYGPRIINGRSILCSVGHMFDTSLIAYGFILVKYKNSKFRIITVLFFILLASLAHGVYDFLLMFRPFEKFAWILNVIYFLITISIFATILNNSLNNSSFFTYKKVVDSEKLVTRLLIYYGIVFLFQFIFVGIESSLEYAFGALFENIWFTGFIICITIVRLSRFKLIRNRWHKIKFELPFHFNFGSSTSQTKSGLRLRIRGESYNEIHVTKFYQEHFYLHPVSKTSSYLGSKKWAFMAEKLFLQNDETYFLVKIFAENDASTSENYLIKPKTSSITLVKDRYPIVAIFKIINFSNIESFSHSKMEFQFIEWAFASEKID